MGRHKKVECRICLKTMRSDILERHMKKHVKKSNGIEEVGSFGSGVCEKAGKHKQVGCKICLKTMRSYTLKRHMKHMKNKPCSIDVVHEKIEYNSNVNVVALKNKIVRGVIEYQRKLELGREIKEIVHELNAPTTSLDKADMEALEFF